MGGGRRQGGEGGGDSGVQRLLGKEDHHVGHGADDPLGAGDEGVKALVLGRYQQLLDKENIYI